MTDHSRVRSYHAQVVERFITRGTHTHHTYTHHTFVLSPWSPCTVEKKINVDSSVYNEHSIGDIVTVWLRQGGFGIPYYDVE